MNPLTYGGGEYPSPYSVFRDLRSFSLFPDEVSALVLDIGTQTTRAGYAGEEIPRCVMPTAYGYVEVTVDAPLETNGTPATTAEVSMNVDPSATANGNDTSEPEKTAAIDEEKKQDEERQEAADKADGMEGIEGPSHGEEAANGKDVSAVEESSTAAPVNVAEDTRLSPSERQRQGSSAQDERGINNASAKQPPSTKKIRQKKYYVGDEGVNVWRAGMEVDSMMTDGIST